MPLMANRELSKVVVMLHLHIVGLVIPIMQVQTLSLASREASPGLRGPVIVTIEGNEQLP